MWSTEGNFKIFVLPGITTTTGSSSISTFLFPSPEFLFWAITMVKLHDVNDLHTLRCCEGLFAR